jgi:hypothetical protein
MSNFHWYDNDNLDYGGIATCEIDRQVRQIADWSAISIMIIHAANTNTDTHRRWSPEPKKSVRTRLYVTQDFGAALKPDETESG